MSKIIINFRYLLGLPKSIYVCLRLCSFIDAVRLPIIVSHKTKLQNLSGKVTLDKVKTGIVRIGFGSVETYDFSYQRTILSITGHVHFNGKAKIGFGSRLSINGLLTLGENFQISAASTIISRHNISIGKDSLIAWECLLTDADHHHILDKEGNIINQPKGIIIGEHVWVCARSTILKGSEIAANCIIGAQSLVSGKFKEEGSLIAGNPASKIKEKIIWKE
ncbi:acyltransferase [Oceanisphaera avium]|uniref:Transferase n=1 Tax=Oceanisphaera avium TaxID=1903694 RepID=A0A1Y0CYC9_9GAMM|nr:acyltransferase [Oceanisphaera avium]ART80332.1 hypothetical protein CBP12_09385 [Oceanisphaera avium]